MAPHSRSLGNLLLASSLLLALTSAVPIPSDTDSTAVLSARDVGNEIPVLENRDVDSPQVEQVSVRSEQSSDDHPPTITSRIARRSYKWTEASFNPREAGVPLSVHVKRALPPVNEDAAGSPSGSPPSGKVSGEDSTITARDFLSSELSTESLSPTMADPATEGVNSLLKAEAAILQEMEGPAALSQSFGASSTMDEEEAPAEGILLGSTSGSLKHMGGSGSVIIEEAEPSLEEFSPPPSVHGGGSLLAELEAEAGMSNEHEGSSSSRLLAGFQGQPNPPSPPADMIAGNVADFMHGSQAGSSQSGSEGPTISLDTESDSESSEGLFMRSPVFDRGPQVVNSVAGSDPQTGSASPPDSSSPSTTEGNASPVPGTPSPSPSPASAPQARDATSSIDPASIQDPANANIEGKLQRRSGSLGQLLTRAKGQLKGRSEIETSDESPLVARAQLGKLDNHVMAGVLTSVNGQDTRPGSDSTSATSTGPSPSITPGTSGTSESNNAEAAANPSDASGQQPSGADNSGPQNGASTQPSTGPGGGQVDNAGKPYNSNVAREEDSQSTPSVGTHQNTADIRPTKVSSRSTNQKRTPIMDMIHELADKYKREDMLAARSAEPANNDGSQVGGSSAYTGSFAGSSSNNGASLTKRAFHEQAVAI